MCTRLISGNVVTILSGVVTFLTIQNQLKAFRAAHLLARSHSYRQDNLPKGMGLIQLGPSQGNHPENDLADIFSKPDRVAGILTSSLFLLLICFAFCFRLFY